MTHHNESIAAQCTYAATRADQLVAQAAKAYRDRDPEKAMKLLSDADRMFNTAIAHLKTLCQYAINTNAKREATAMEQAPQDLTDVYDALGAKPC